MKLFDYLNKEMDYSDCESLIEVASIAHDAIEDFGIATEHVLDELSGELGITDLSILFSEFKDLDDADIYTDSLSDVFQFEEMAAKYPWDVADVVVGLLLLHGEAELREKLAELPYRNE